LCPGGSSRTVSPPSPRARSRRSHTATTTSESLASWLRCVHCAEPLEALDGFVLGCENGHRFDAGKRGYLNLLDPGKGITGDPRELLEARARFLGAGHFEPIADAVAAALPTTTPLSILDSGAGTGYYLRQVLSRSPGPVDALATDASSAAVAMSIAATGSAGLVADVWRPSPVRDSRADVILCVFAPRNPAEFARILRDDGRLIVVTPTGAHLRELREAGLVMGMQDDKRDRLDAAVASQFDLLERTETSYTIDLDAAAARDLTTMGPSGHHDTSGTWPGGAVTVSVDCSVFAVNSATRTA
jgi:23S rRNA (guanine745-N1)-methyltransferase